MAEKKLVPWWVGGRQQLDKGVKGEGIEVIAKETL